MACVVTTLEWWLGVSEMDEWDEGDSLVVPEIVSASSRDESLHPMMR